ncbi:hypothetical protein AGRA3207_006084 [Actinomadura graeca]|uniref:Uncharacterized protein n=1 Tax=Actinomadura graeca TaxID=2750812 RepID=A0ABX8R0U5_9ACTN|nr:hypothetical protein [Actinomadura graeca]QXJ24706.1 hypothetical protein AGRA3207_006084 [Actinomadura graeca]
MTDDQVPNDPGHETVLPPVAWTHGGEGGPGPDRPAQAAEFARRQAGTVRSEPVLAEHRDAAASWLHENADGLQDDPGSLVDAVIARVLARPDQKTLLETHALLTELGRDPAFSALITERLTGDVMHRIIRLSGTRRPEEG